MSIFLFLLQQYILSFLNKNVNFLYFYLENAYLDISQYFFIVYHVHLLYSIEIFPKNFGLIFLWELCICLH